jgi:23S rRNA (pseudouridine1915-N3)-methyltransferase
MAKITLLVGGSIKGTPEALIFQEYKKRILWPINLIEVKTQKDFIESFSQLKTQINTWIMLDEHGENLTSVELSAFLNKQIETYTSIGFMIGIDVGIDDSIKKQCPNKISFGAQTWPHLLVRVMLIEQLYRSQQIIKNHPYHKA